MENRPPQKIPQKHTSKRVFDLDKKMEHKSNGVASHLGQLNTSKTK